MALTSSIISRTLGRLLHRGPHSFVKPPVDPALSLAELRVQTATFKAWFALEAFRVEAANATCWYCMWFRLAIGQELTAAYFCHNDQVVIEEAMRALQGVKQRFDDSGHTRWHMTPMEVEMVRDGLDLTDQALSHTTTQEKFDVHKLVQKAMQDVIQQH